jgi:xylulokinase
MTLVAGVDSSTQSCTVLVVDAADGRVVRRGRAPHPRGTEVDPHAWLVALQNAVGEAGGLDDVAAMAVGAQQHGMVCLDDAGTVVRPALLWNDTRSAGAAADLVAELGAMTWAEATGSVPVASFTVTKLRWLSEHEPAAARRVAAVCLPHDWLTWRLAGAPDLGALTTDRGDASGTGYWSPAAGAYRPDLLARAFGRAVELPRVAGPRDVVGHTAAGTVLAAGTGDNMAAALALGARPGETIVSIGTSGTVSAPTAHAVSDPTGTIAGFADATGNHLPLVCTLNGAAVLAAMARALGVDLAELADLALRAPTGAEGLVLVPYLAGERTPNLPDATGAVHGLTTDNLTPANLARAAVEGLLCGLAAGIEALADAGLPTKRVLLTGGGARSPAVSAIAPAVFGCPVATCAPEAGVALGAARQAAWALAGTPEPPDWPATRAMNMEADPTTAVLDRYRRAQQLVLVSRDGM